MSYRRGYYRKDGTYVQGHYVNSRSNLKQNRKKGGCAGALVLVITCMTTLLFI